MRLLYVCFKYFPLTAIISFSLSVRFCIPGYRNLFLVLISSCMGLAQDSISMWYHIVVYRFSHRPWTAHKCQRQGFRHTMHHEASLHYKVWNGRGWHAECIYLCMHVFECGLWCNSVNKENAWCTCLPRLILFSRSVDLHRVAS